MRAYFDKDFNRKYNFGIYRNWLRQIFILNKEIAVKEIKEFSNASFSYSRITYESNNVLPHFRPFWK